MKAAIDGRLDIVYADGDPKLIEALDLWENEWFPALHLYADLEMFGEACSVNADCGGLGNLCVRMLDGEKRCTAACTHDAGCGEGSTCRQVASARSRAIYGRACVPRL